MDSNPRETTCTSQQQSSMTRASSKQSIERKNQPTMTMEMETVEMTTA